VNHLATALRGAWNFVVGDDWRIAIGVAGAISLTALLATTAVAAWWVLPVAVIALLVDSLRRAARTR
jgi:hypothetical protein